MVRSSRVDHVAFLVRDENFEAALARSTEVLGLSFDGPYDLADRGIRIAIDWDAGIEFITPTNSDIALGPSVFLDEHGEGFYRLVLGVRDLEDAVAKATSHGLPAGARTDGLKIDPRWRDRFDRIDEVTIGEVVPGVFITLGQIEEK